MLPFRRIYFDSNILVKSGWPKLSTDLQNILSLARLMKVRALLLAPVERELEAHWLRDFRKSLGEAQGKADNVRRLLGEVRSAGEIVLKLDADPKTDHGKRVEEAIAVGLERVPWQSRLTEEFFEMAIRHQKPFKDKGSGFQDAVICLAAIDDLALSKEKTGALVSRDGVFEQGTIDKLAGPSKVRMILYEETESVKNVFLDELSAAFKSKWERDQAAALAACRGAVSLIQGYLTVNLDVPERNFFGEILRVNKLEVTEIVNARTPYPLDRKAGEPIVFSIDVKVDVHVLMKKSQFIWPVARTLKVGAEVPTAPNPFFAAPAESEPRETVLKRDVELQIKTEDERYADVQPIGAKFK